MTVATIQLQDVVVQAQGRVLLHIPHLQIHAGERVAIVGANGAGKSTLLRVLTGLVRCSGTVSVLQHTVRPALGSQGFRQLRAQVAQVMQGVHLVARLSALDNVLIGCLARTPGWRSCMRWHTAADQTLARTALQSVGLLAQADVRADQLSGGERQKVALARLLMQKPLLILADEPTAALDPAAAAEVCHLLVQAAQNATLMTVVHNPALVPVLAQRVIGLQAGSIAFDLPAHALDGARLEQLYRSNSHVQEQPHD